jgi:hypothetical protein
MATGVPEHHTLAPCFDIRGSRLCATLPGRGIAAAIWDLEITRIETKTTELVVEMSGLYCSAVNVCGGSCAETIAQTIRSRVEIREFPHE